MANAVWFEITGDSTRHPNIEAVRAAAIQAAKSTDRPIEIYRVVSTLVRTVQRQITVQETDPPA